MLTHFGQKSLAILLLLGCAAFQGHADTLIVSHDLRVHIDPARHRLSVVDSIQLNSPAQDSYEFFLHAGVTPSVASAGASLTRVAEYRDGVPVNRYRLRLAPAMQQFTLRYSGAIQHGLHEFQETPGRKRQVLAGTIEDQGVFLDAGVAWFPLFDDSMQRFELEVSLPAGWTAVSQGAGPDLTQSGGRSISHWRESQPQDDIYLVAGRFERYRQEAEGIHSQVYLLQKDDALAQRYLNATARYLQLYRELIGDYPYAKFAMVENFWQTGYGMPSFTLLGSRVIRLPFILHSSYPHEILHNWWGNSVYVDYSQGNWSEGLTAYLADHLLKEQAGKGEDHRRNALQRFEDYVRTDNDFPLADFRARHSGSSSAVGYDKSLMLFHMLRRKIGDREFITGLRNLYAQMRFRAAGFDDIQRIFQQAGGQDLTPFFKQWTQRRGAPFLVLEQTSVTQESDHYRVDLTLAQKQQGDVYRLDVPVLSYFSDDQEPQVSTLSLNQGRQSFTLEFDSRPQRIEVDPWFDLFRQLHPQESPPTLSDLFGSNKALFVLPGGAGKEELAAWRALAQSWAQGYADSEIVLDSEMTELPRATAIWLLGSVNQQAADFVRQLRPAQYQSNKESIVIDGQAIRPDEAVVLVQRSGNRSLPTAWISSPDVSHIPGLARKLPHYGKYSYLSFAGNGPVNRLKGAWRVTQSPLHVQLDNKAGPANRPTHPALSDLISGNQ